MNNVKMLSIIFLCISVVLLTACKEANTQKEKEDESIEIEKVDTSVSSNFECFFASFDVSCIKFDLNEKEKLNLFFKDQETIGNLEIQYKPRTITLGKSPFNTIFWTDINTGEVIYEISYDLSIHISKENTTTEVHYIELTDFKNNRKLFLNNSDKNNTNI
ncbi:hypothetical protein [Lysinibacillus fusiformis]|uniref:hypothetical protein n=1 Tax=Lysinibacillus fusiformis TaxID=28031 RepID=UPI000D362774|nr:hypothetical protein [Lysinibacillus fusiformis]MED4672355.1 hypothetical protein [Lysinibacillus fusiformis]RDV32246.1 hypothetical protein C7B90_11010 [Lysinibacillus fusiformis]GED65604.1 hypothetical protein LFU01_40560 [Lysinibacillus fusiformis]